MKSLYERSRNTTEVFETTLTLERLLEIKNHTFVQKKPNKKQGRFTYDIPKFPTPEPKRPFKGKIPMKKEVIGVENKLYSYDFYEGKIQLLYLGTVLTFADGGE